MKARVPISSLSSARLSIASLLGFAASLALLASPAWAAQVMDVRVGRHAGFTRVVFELDGAAGYRLALDREPGAAPQLVVALEAASAPRTVRPRTGLVEVIELQPQREITIARMRLRAQHPEVEEMILLAPPRIVIDVREGRASATTPGPAPPTAADAPAEPRAAAPRRIDPQPVAPAPPPSASANAAAATSGAPKESEARSEGVARAESPKEGEARSEGAARAESPKESEARTPGAARADSPKASEAHTPGASPAEPPRAGEVAPGPSPSAPPAAAAAAPGAAAHTELAQRSEPPVGAPVRSPSVPTPLAQRAPAGVPAPSAAASREAGRRLPSAAPSGSPREAPMPVAAPATAGKGRVTGMALLGLSLLAVLALVVGVAAARRRSARAAAPSLQAASGRAAAARAMPHRSPGVGEPAAVEIETRLGRLEARLDSLLASCERLERQAVAHTEELRVQRAAIARTQRVVRGLLRSDADAQQSGSTGSRV